MAFVGAFVAAVVSGQLAAGCGDSCNCDTTPPRPQAQPPLTRLEVASYDSRGEIAELPFTPQGGTLEVTGDTVVISYQHAGADHRILYQVVGPR